MKALRSGTIDAEGSLGLRGAALSGRAYGAGDGIAQLVGQSLALGEELVVTGLDHADGRLVVRGRSGTSTITAVFRGVKGGRLTVELGRDRHFRGTDASGVVRRPVKETSTRSK